MTIYKATNKLNGKVYIGKHARNIPVDYRWKEHIGAARNGSKYYFHCAIRKYGIEAFEFSVLVDGIKNKFLLGELEKKFIKLYRATDRRFGYNIAEGGEGGGLPKGWHHTVESRIKISNQLKGKKRNYDWHSPTEFQPGHEYVPLSQESLEKLSNSMKGKEFSQQHCENLSRALTGRSLSLQHREAIAKAHVSPEVKERCSNARKGKEPWNKGLKGVYSEESLRKMSETHTGMKDSLETRIKKSESYWVNYAEYGSKSKGRKSWNKGLKGVYSEESIKKMSEAHTGKKDSLETLEKKSKAQRFRYDMEQVDGSILLQQHFSGCYL